MSWDVLVVKNPEGDPEQSTPLGSGDEVAAVLRRVVPDIDLSEPAWGQLRGPDWSMEFNIGARTPVDAVMLHVRGGGDGALEVIHRVAAAFGAEAVDCTDGEVLRLDGAGGWPAFQEYRDQVTGPAS
ncbi:hypothetical protein [Streptomyces sp. NPDC005438]|uniref:hypothetical protein n=1 Tax=Streptomyces sp. NPDC005438 TaxID=3156880 RepID=UPI0033A27002